VLLRPNVRDATPHNLIFDVANGKQRVIEPDPRLFIRADVEDTYSLGSYDLETAPGIVCRLEINETTFGGLNDPTESIRDYLGDLSPRNVVVGSPLGMRALRLSKVYTRARIGWPIGFSYTTASAKGIFIPEARPVAKSQLAIAELALQGTGTRPLLNAMADDVYVLAGNHTHPIQRTPSPLRFDLRKKHLGYAHGRVPLIGGYVRELQPFDLSAIPPNALLLVYSDMFPWLPPEIASRAVCGGGTERIDGNQLPIFKSLARYSPQTISYARTVVGF